MSKLDEAEDELKSLQRKQMRMIVDADKLQKELAEASSKFCELSPDYVKVECPKCQGTGQLVGQDSTGKQRKVKCDACNMDCFMWMKLYKEK